MRYIKIAKVDVDDIQMYQQIDDNGNKNIQCTEEYEQFKEWLAEGNTPEEAE
jgi:hypothetical protein